MVKLALYTQKYYMYPHIQRIVVYDIYATIEIFHISGWGSHVLFHLTLFSILSNFLSSWNNCQMWILIPWQKIGGGGAGNGEALCL